MSFYPFQDVSSLETKDSPRSRQWHQLMTQNQHILANIKTITLPTDPVAISVLTLPQSPSLHLLFSLFYNEDKSVTKTPYEFTQTSIGSKNMSQCMERLKQTLNKASQEITINTSKYLSDALIKGLKLIKG